ncbi:hypothetical protein WOLCODRAFT_158639 [Wolfiporia cocos MD-104 SS10]|uniref:Uncharacterized protein n=1 Tax=Wolfiporia cocos (strain MD-104) TaxID=742152 RepID=A0A2H3JA79_WOLCO|nr:hypothetical protein WOLCODRAFT_158639 [Wolfiporia cocos MD-104 SS10]
MKKGKPARRYVSAALDGPRAVQPLTQRSNGVAYRQATPRRRNTARRHGNDDDTGVITAARRPPFGKEPAPVATPAALSRSPPILRNKAKNRAPTKIRKRSLPPSVWGIGTPRPPLHITTVTPLTSSLTIGKMGPTMPPGSSLGRHPCLA